MTESAAWAVPDSFVGALEDQPPGSGVLVRQKSA